MIDGNLQKIQNLPEKKRKIILWLIVIIIGIVLGYFWIKNFQEKINNFRMEDFKNELNIPNFQ